MSLRELEAINWKKNKLQDQVDIISLELNIDLTI